MSTGPTRTDAHQTDDDIDLWSDAESDFGSAMQRERDGESPFAGIVRYNVVRPRLHPVRPSRVAANGAAAIICPGGGFHFLTMDNEGYALAELLTEHGVTCFVLSYRTIETPADPEEAKAVTMSAFMDGANRIEPFTAPLLVDGPQAVRTVRAQSAAFGVDPSRVAMIGFSAGARLTAATILEGPVDGRPDAAGIVYLPGVPPHAVPEDAPPMFIVAATDDQIGTAGNEDLYTSWRRAGRPVEMHMFERGGHGFGIRSQGLPLDGWPQLLVGWLRTHGFID